MTFDRSGTSDKQRQLLELTLVAMQELELMRARAPLVPWLRIWDYDPHRTYRSWLIQIPEDDDPGQPAPLVLERTWDAAEDRERLARDLRRRPRLEPTLCVREARLPKDEFAYLRTVGAKMPYPRLELRDAHTSLQPAQFGIEGFRKDAVQWSTARIRLEWGGTPRTGMEAVATWATRLRSLCTGCFPDENISILRAGPTGSCSLCRQAALADTHSCPVCRATYHRECWDYVGRCAAYGCTGASNS